MRDCYTEAYGRLDGERRFGRFGPKLLKEKIEERKLSDWVLPARRFCPIGWSETPLFFEAEPPDLSGAWGVHLWQQMLRKTNRDLSANYPSTSLWEQWKREYA